MDNVVRGVHVKDAEQHPVVWGYGRDETKNSDKQEHDTEKQRSGFNYFSDLCWVERPLLMAALSNAGKPK